MSEVSEESATGGAGEWPLEPPEEVLREWFSETLELLFEHLRTLPEQPSRNVEGAVAEACQLDDALPENPQQALPLLRKLVREYAPRSFNTAGPGYLAYIPGGGLVTAALADLISNITNRYVGVFAASPLLARLEVIALRWLMDLYDYPPEARGIFTSGGSLANLTAFICARHDRLGPRFQDGVVYCSDQVHHSIHSAAYLAGFLAENVRHVPIDARRSLDAGALRQAIAKDRARGLRPALVVASTGTVNTGDVDDLAAVGAVARAEGLWLHIDGAYGACFQLTEEGRRKFQGIDQADSITMDPHKGLFLPYGTGCLLVRDGEKLRAPHASDTDYLPPMQSEVGTQDFCEYSPELSRDFRGLRVWLSFQLFGVAAFRKTLQEKLDLTRVAARALAASPYLELVTEPALSIVAFRVARPGVEGDRLTQELMDRVHAHRRIMFSATLVNKRFTLRLCILNFRTHRERLEEGLQQLLEESAKLCLGNPTS